jgi:hypothetical protein
MMVKKLDFPQHQEWLWLIGAVASPVMEPVDGSAT